MHRGHQPEGLMPRSLALAYAVTAYITGIFLITPEHVTAVPVSFFADSARRDHRCVPGPRMCARDPFSCVRPEPVGEPMARIVGASAANGEKIVAAICSAMAAAIQKEFFA